ncbi:MAG: hypothetical protein ACREBC_24110, partial [Pyrinomonadaceae bacterium]
MQTKALPNQSCKALSDAWRRLSARRRGVRQLLPLLLIFFTTLAGTSVAETRESPGEQIAKLVVQIQRADYEGDRLALKRLFNDLAPFADDKEFGAKVRYWRGFA